MLFFEKKYFQSHESHQLSSNIRISARLFFRENQIKRVIEQEILYDTKKTK